VPVRELRLPAAHHPPPGVRGPARPGAACPRPGDPMTRARSRALALAPALAAVFALASPVRAQAPGSGIPPADSLVRVSAAPVRIAPGGAARARVRIAIAHGWHIDANPASPDYMIATAVTLAPAGGVSAGVPRYPAAQKLRVEFDAST